MTDLEFLIIYNQQGDLILSRCFGNTCASLLHDDVLLASFIERMKSKHSGEFENYYSVFSTPIKTKHTIVVGVKKLIRKEDSNAEENIQKLFDKLHHTIDLSPSLTLSSNSTQDEFFRIESELIENIVIPWFVEGKATFHDCDKAEKCIFRNVATALIFKENPKTEESTLWDNFNEAYHYIRRRDEEKNLG